MFFLLLLSTSLINACELDGGFSISERSLMSAYIVEGEIIAKESVWLKNENRIITINTVEISSNFSNQEKGTIEIITNGGIIDDEWHHASSELNLEIGDSGIFFLDKEKEYISADNKVIKGKYAHFGKSSLININTFTNEITDHKTKYNSKADLYKLLPTVKYKKTKTHTASTQKMVNNAISIDCFFPDVIRAGAGDTLTIEGSGFGTFDDGCMVVFSNADDGGSSFTSVPLNFLPYWTDTKIKVVVPQRAGTGTIKIYTTNNGSQESDETLFIPFALKTSNGDQTATYLIDKNGQGGYTLTMHENMLGIAQEPFIRALNTLRDDVGFNVNISTETTTIATASNDGLDVVAFDTDVFPINSVGISYSQFRRCGNGWEVAGIDMFFKSPDYNLVNWYFGEASPLSGQMDFESVALHELLHAFQLGHNNQTESVLYSIYTLGEAKRSLVGCYDLTAADAINERSLTYMPNCSGHNPYYPYNDFYKVVISGLTCQTANESCFTPSLSIKVFLEGFYDGNGLMISEFGASYLLPVLQPFNQAPWYHNGTELNYANIPQEQVVDWVLVEFYPEDNPAYAVKSKACLLLTDGSIIESNGYYELDLTGLEDKNYFINISQASHLTIRNEIAIDLNNTVLDFTTNAATSLGEVIHQTTDGKYAMYAGDFDHNGIINNLDYNLWALNSAAVQTYTSIDADGNTIVNNIDYNYWSINRSKLSPAIYIE